MVPHQPCKAALIMNAIEERLALLCHFDLFVMQVFL